MEMNSRQLLVESRVDGIEDTLRSLKVKKTFVCCCFCSSCEKIPFDEKTQMTHFFSTVGNDGIII